MCVHLCSCIDSLKEKYFMTLCIFELFPFWMQWSHTNLSSRGSIFSSQKPWVTVHLELVLVVTNSVCWLKWDSFGDNCLILYQFGVWLETHRVHRPLAGANPSSQQTIISTATVTDTQHAFLSKTDYATTGGEASWTLPNVYLKKIKYPLLRQVPKSIWIEHVWKSL